MGCVLIFHHMLSDLSEHLPFSGICQYSCQSICFSTALFSNKSTPRVRVGVVQVYENHHVDAIPEIYAIDLVDRTVTTVVIVSSMQLWCYVVHMSG
jgi:hypothetical protein